MSDYKSNESSIHSSDVEQWLEDELREAGVNPDDIEIDDEEELQQFNL